MPNFLEYVASTTEISEMVRERILPHFTKSIWRNNIQVFTGDTLRLWVADMLLSGIKITTVRRYLGGLHSVYKNWVRKNSVTESDPFNMILSIISKIKVSTNRTSKDNVKLLSSVVTKTSDPAEYVYTGILSFLLYDVTYSLQDTIDLKFDSFESVCPQLIEIVERMKKNRNAKYVFPLGHGNKRMTTIRSEVLNNIRYILLKRGLRFENSFSRDSITALWIQSAWQCGVSVSVIRSMVKSIPDEFSFLSILKSEPVEPEVKIDTLLKVADSISDRTPRWYVMKLRTGKKPEDVKQKLETYSPEILESLLFYYPMHRTVKKINKKNIIVEEPVLPNILFFRTYHDFIGIVMRNAGDCGWCYKTSNRPSSPYSTISLSEMRKFQRHVGSFSPDIKLLLHEFDKDANVGDTVKVIGGGPFDGQVGQVMSIKESDGKISYSIRLTQSVYIKWNEIAVDSVFVEPLGS